VELERENALRDRARLPVGLEAADDEEVGVGRRVVAVVEKGAGFVTFERGLRAVGAARPARPCA
jgi:hypothetical protein